MACHGLLCSILYRLRDPSNICPEERWCCVFRIVLGGGRKLQFVPSGYVSRPLLLIQLVDTLLTFFVLQELGGKCVLSYLQTWRWHGVYRLHIELRVYVRFTLS